METLAGIDMAAKLKLLRDITNDFSVSQQVGKSGGYGVVYRARLHDGKEIAVKNLNLEGTVDDKDFFNEVTLNLRVIEHENIVRLLGYCWFGGYMNVRREGSYVPTQVEHVYRVLCFEYMEGRSLDEYISDAEPCHLDWATCYNIIRGTCEGLKHLHTLNSGPIYHMDIKPANILLDKDMTPKIGDLGLSKLVATTDTHTTKILRGTEGYLPPEYIKERRRSPKLDVFSLGVTIIQMLAGTNAYVSHRQKTAQEFTEYVTRKWSNKLQGTWGNLYQEIAILQVKACVDIALRCVKDNRNQRPDIKGIVNELVDLEAQIKEKNKIGFQSLDSNVISVDPALELRFLFKPREDISCCLQLTNMTNDNIAFNIQTKRKYNTLPSRGIMRPGATQYVSVTLPAQEAPQNMPRQDMLRVESVKISSDQEITEDFFKNAMTGKVVITRPIVWVAQDKLWACASLKEVPVPMRTSS